MSRFCADLYYESIDGLLRLNEHLKNSIWNQVEQRLVVRPTNSVPGPAAKRLKIEVVIHTREVYKQFNQICIYIHIVRPGIQEEEGHAVMGKTRHTCSFQRSWQNGSMPEE